MTARLEWDPTLLDEGSFDHYARLVRRLLQVPVALVSLVEPERQVFPGALGLPESYASTRRTPLSHSFCQYVVADSEALVINDARHHPRVADNLAIEDLGVVAYAGWPLRDEHGQTIGSLCAIEHVPREWTSEEVDVLSDLARGCSAEIQRTMRRARDSEDLMRAIFESVDVAMAFYDTDGHLLTANSRAGKTAALGGFDLDTPPHAGPHVRYSDNQTVVPPEHQMIPRALRGEHSPHGSAWIGPPGEQIAVAARSQRLSRDDGSPWGTLVVAQDVTDLARSLQVKDEFIATVSHELRTPLTAILGYLEVIEDETDPGDRGVVDSLEKIRRNARNLQKRIAELLDTADRRRSLELQPTDLSVIARRMATTFDQAVESAELELVIRADTPCPLTADVDRVEQVLENLLSNAVKFTAPGGRITLTTGCEGGSVTATVTDTGAGMSPDELAQAFDTFWRSEAARKDAIQGIGIGLGIVRNLVAAHGGSVGITSRPGEGTSVTCTLPSSPPGRLRR